MGKNVYKNDFSYFLNKIRFSELFFRNNISEPKTPPSWYLYYFNFNLKILIKNNESKYKKHVSKSGSFQKLEKNESVDINMNIDR